ncbi:hypothetical protein HRG_002524 [Hirsutella rhossiliensis]|uniref:Uncharacterized protein n=1 Tax=Hirsutella rhossiliensis TaxID=111463 RepID=A0A9P8SMQ7_9HYPO|nr:uncharacterized protein HRG_02524 [Hirsutella rhossiliensis]KAH0967115.1 hypothetical protein HRG_02524 [Hirsutella rhossiliensis]
MEVKVPSSASAPMMADDSAPPVEQPMGKITKIAGNEKQLEEIQAPNRPVAPVMMQFVKEAGKKVKKPSPRLLSAFPAPRILPPTPNSRSLFA